ncbi:proline-tRNA ligase [Schizosaccharomyces japonicus yFS275]|uniref:proline--tRNA ligase n=1 Tax=Schizosaccharomyces japonicus (strain yFS275 / FY16936) TaxID=402676 RepID=B6K1X3_SCHJY|nr:proline-tRNA ligase [Schizosaccharomyces japonicus yFS275]EEB07154.1 proline-tRNA ligase [Schizosaccharomyces japonicus yFS275]
MIKFVRNRASQLLLKESGKNYVVPKNVSSLLIDQGYVQQSSSGVFQLLPLGLRVMDNISNIVHQELAGLGAIRVSLASLSAKAVWQQSKRWEKMGSEMLHIRDRAQRDYCLCPTHEEEMTRMVANVFHSSKQLPISVYQIGSKYRDEARPRGGLLRAKEFLMMDLYTYDATKEAAEKTYERVFQSFHRIFRAIGLPYTVAEAQQGTMGGAYSHEFHYLNEVGEDVVLRCPQCLHAANTDAYHGSIDKCVHCGGELLQQKCIEVGHTFNLGQTYTRPFQLCLSNGDALYMNSYGIGISRLLAAVAHMTHDEKGLVWPTAIAPWKIIILPASDSKIPDAEALYDSLAQTFGANNILLDDRGHKSYGRKIRDAELIGFPFIITVGESYTRDGSFDVLARASNTRYKLKAAQLHTVVSGNFA